MVVVQINIGSLVWGAYRFRRESGFAVCSVESSSVEALAFDVCVLLRNLLHNEQTDKGELIEADQ